MTAMNNWILTSFGKLFCVTALVMLLVVIAAYISPLGKIKIGGPSAKPLLSRWKWFSIVLCTTVAIGILFWSAAEPVFHFIRPPAFSGVKPGSAEAAKFAMSTMFLHWTFTPYAIYTVPSLVFALVYYNSRGSYSLGALVQPICKHAVTKSVGELIDAICLYSLVAGMAAALGAGMLTLAGGVEKLFGISVTPFTLGVAAVSIVFAVGFSSVSGLMNGIRILSDWNAKIFFALLLFVFVTGPTLYIIQLGGISLIEYITDVIPRTAAIGAENDVGWFNGWTVFYWAVWMAWAPVTALFLGRIGYGYSVREYIVFNFVLPSVFGIVWMSVFSGAAINFQMEGVTNLHQTIVEGGVEQAIYALFAQLPGAKIISFFFIGISFLSFVTAADSSISAMGGISSTGISPESPEASMGVKILWGVSVGLVAWVMVSFLGVDGIKMSSNLGGFPALFLLIVVTFALIAMIVRHKQYIGEPQEESHAVEEQVSPVA